MAKDSDSPSFFVERIPVKRWRLYLLQFEVVFLVPLTVAAAYEMRRDTVIRLLAEGAGLAMIMCLLSFSTDGRGKAH